MARLAIRATGDKTARENVTTGNERITAHMYNGNTMYYTIILRSYGDVLEIHNHKNGTMCTVNARDWFAPLHETSETHSA